jgi:hypothetical protein
MRLENAQSRMDAHSAPDWETSARSPGIASYDPQAVASGDIDRFILEPLALAARLPKPGGYNDGATHTVFAALMDDLRDRLRRRDDDGKVHRLSDRLDRWMACPAFDLFVFWIDGVERAGIPGSNEILEDPNPYGIRSWRGSHNGHGRRRKDSMQIMRSHAPLPPRSEAFPVIHGPAHPVAGTAAEYGRRTSR